MYISDTDVTQCILSQADVYMMSKIYQQFELIDSRNLTNLGLVLWPSSSRQIVTACNMDMDMDE